MKEENIELVDAGADGNFFINFGNRDLLFYQQKQLRLKNWVIRYSANL